MLGRHRCGVRDRGPGSRRDAGLGHEGGAGRPEVRRGAEHRPHAALHGLEPASDPDEQRGHRQEGDDEDPGRELHALGVDDGVDRGVLAEGVVVDRGLDLEDVHTGLADHLAHAPVRVVQGGAVAVHQGAGVLKGVDVVVVAQAAVAGQPGGGALVATVHRDEVDVHVDDEVALGRPLGDLDLLALLGLTQEGEVVIRVMRNKEASLSACESAKPVMPLLIVVRDTGIGMSEQTVKRLFEAFIQADSSTTRRYGGTGLGLAISRSLVQLFGGELGLDSHLGQGSTFYFTLPCQALPAPPFAHSPQSMTAPALSDFDETLALRCPLKILLAEDNMVSRKVALRILAKFGYQADAVENGIQVLQRAGQQAYDLILMDVAMPEIDGIEATQRIRQMPVAHPIPTIIAMTAATTVTDREQCLAAGMDNFLGKPLSIQALRRTLETVSTLRKSQEAVNEPSH